MKQAPQSPATLLAKGNIVAFTYTNQKGETKARIVTIDDVIETPKTGLPYILATEVGAEHPKRFSIPNLVNLHSV